MLRKLILFTTAIVLTTNWTNAQTIQWEGSYGSAYSETAYSIQLTADGGYVYAGVSNLPGGDVSVNYGFSDLWVVKLNNIGVLEWEKSYGGSSLDHAASVQQTTDGGYIVAGQTRSEDGNVSSNHGIADYWVIKLTETGSIEWEKTYGGSGFDGAESIQQTIDGGYIVAGFSGSTDGDITDSHGNRDYWIVKLDDTGIIEWEKSLGGTNTDQAKSIQQTTDGGYIVAGESISVDGDITDFNGHLDYWVVKLTTTGEMEWEKSLGGTGMDKAYDAIQTLDGGYIIAGGSESDNGYVSDPNGLWDYWIVKLTATGDLEWEKSYGGSQGDVAQSIQQTIGGGYIISGYTASSDGDVTGHHDFNDAWMVKITSTGIIEWEKSLGGSLHDYSFDVRETVDGGYISAGHSSSDDGDISAPHVHGCGINDVWIVKVLPAQSGIDEVSTLEGLTTYPNPANHSIAIKTNSALRGETYFIYDNLGRIVFKGKITNTETQVNVASLANGFYEVHIQTSNTVFKSRFLKQ